MMRSIAIAAGVWSASGHEVLVPSSRSRTRYATPAFQLPHHRSRRRTPHVNTALLNGANNEDNTTSSPSFLSTNKATVSFKSNTNVPSNLSPIDQLILTLTSDQTSLLLGSIGILLILANRLISFPDDDAIYEASRSRIDLLGVFAAGSVLLNGITKLDVESAQAERVVLEGVKEDKVTWNEGSAIEKEMGEKIQSTVEWALTSFLKCSPARTAVLLTTQSSNAKWMPLAMGGILPSDPQLQSMIPDEVKGTPILDRMLREDDSIKGGTVGGTEVVGASKRSRRGPKESYLPTLQALPGKVEFTYLPANAQEALILPVTRHDGNAENNKGWYYAVVLGGDTAKSFAPRDIAWCKEIASWIGELVP